MLNGATVLMPSELEAAIVRAPLTVTPETTVIDAIALQSQAEREQLVAAIATQIRSSLGLQTILDTTVEQIRQLLGCDRVSIWQFEADWQTIAVAESTDSTLSLVGERVNDVCFKQDWTEFYHQGQIRIVSDIYTTAMADCHRELLIRLQTRAKVLVPLLCGDELWGLLCIHQCGTIRHWQQSEIDFIQIDSALNRQYQGTGLGLALVKQIVELHSGRVALTSELGVGSCFTIELPYASTSTLRSAPTLALPSVLDTATPDATSVYSPLILLVEDNEANISTVSSYLKAND